MVGKLVILSSDGILQQEAWAGRISAAGGPGISYLDTVDGETVEERGCLVYLSLPDCHRRGTKLKGWKDKCFSCERPEEEALARSIIHASIQDCE